MPSQGETPLKSFPEMKINKINCSFTLMARFRLWKLKRAGRGKMIHSLSFDTYPGTNCFSKEELNRIGSELAQAKDIYEMNQIGSGYGFDWNMAGLDYEDKCLSGAFLCESNDGIRFFATEKSLLQYLDAKKISLTKYYILKFV